MTISIGQAAAETGFPASTLRYYEQIGLLPAPERVSGRRVYSEAAIDRLRVIALARSLDFSLDDVRDLLDGFPADTPASDRWRVANTKRIAALEEQATSIERMLGLLRHLSEECSCPDLAQCASAWVNLPANPN